MRYIIVDKDDRHKEALFNTRSQNIFFGSPHECNNFIKDHLDEPESEDGEGGVCTLRTDGKRETDFQIFKLILIK